MLQAIRIKSKATYNFCKELRHTGHLYGLENKPEGARVKEELIEKGVHNLRDHEKLEVFFNEIVAPYIQDGEALTYW